SSVMTDHEHGLGASGLRRIRQQPPSRVATISSASSSRAPSVGPRTAPIITTTHSESRKSSYGAMSTAPSSPTMNFTEDLTRFPSESLHSFSFAHQSTEDFMHNRQNVLKRSIEFMTKSISRHGGSQVSLASIPPRTLGDQDSQGGLDSEARAKVARSDEAGEVNGFGFTGGLVASPPPQFDSDNVFEKSYGHRSESPDEMAPLSPTHSRKSQEVSDVAPSEGYSDVLSRTTTGESFSTDVFTAPAPVRPGYLRSFTDTTPSRVRSTVVDAMVQQPYIANDKYGNGRMLSPPLPQGAFNAPQQSSLISPYLDAQQRSHYGTSPTYGLSESHASGAVHGHSNRWAPAAQAIFTTQSHAPWTILAANDLACLVFGVTNAEVRKMGIMEVVREERRAWLEEKLAQPGSEAEHKSRQASNASNQQDNPRSTTSFLLGRGGITAALLNKPSSRQVKESRRTQTDDGAGSSVAAARKQAGKIGLNHANNKSRGVLLCGDVVPIQKRNGHTGSASLWVKEKKGGLIWVLEEIHEDVAILRVDSEGVVTGVEGPAAPIWGESLAQPGVDIGTLLPRIPRQGINPRTGALDYAEVTKQRFFTARNSNAANVPVAIERVPGGTDLRVSSFPHIAGIVVLSAATLQITSANSVFCAALFGQSHPDRLHITDLIPGFDRILKILTEDDNIQLIDGSVVPEQSFRRARAFAALQDGKGDAAAYFLRPDGIAARHRDGSEIKIDLQMRVVKSEKQPTTPLDEHVILEEGDDDDEEYARRQGEIVYAVWITYSRHLHAGLQQGNASSATTPRLSDASTPLRQPSPGQTQVSSPVDMDSSDEPAREVSHASSLAQQLKEAARKTTNKLVGRAATASAPPSTVAVAAAPAAAVMTEPPRKKTIDDFVILEDMGQGAYGQVKLARNKHTGAKVVLKFVTKRRILVDTWTRDRRLGTVPLEIHVLDYLRRNGLSHPNIVAMHDFFEDDVNYYIEMLPHGLPGMDLFDYIELRVNMEEAECRGIFAQVARAVGHLHAKAQVVHRDIKDENVVLDGEGTVRLIDFGSAAYIKNGPFDVFVGTIDYAAPEVLAGRPYGGKEQDVWALGILLYTIIYKENPFYSIDEIMDRDLRVPYVMSEPSIDLIRKMLDRDVAKRVTIEQVLEHPWLAEGEGGVV
ncbi:serine/threonine protein kinase, partial [Pseudogymnoascus australis]